MTGSAQIDALRAEARYHRERYDLYRAKMYAQRPTTMGRLKELERAHQDSEARLRRAEQERASDNRDLYTRAARPTPEPPQDSAPLEPRGGPTDRGPANRH